VNVVAWFGGPDSRHRLKELTGFSILGRAFRAEGAQQDLIRWLRTYWHYPEHAPPEHHHRIELEVLPVAPGRMGDHGAAQDACLPDRTLRFVRQDRSWELRSGDSGLRFELLPGVSRIESWGVERSPDAESVYRGLYVALSEALRHSGLLPLHAAVAERDGAATAWLAPSGGGKSTTLLHAARAGWHPIAEDLCWLDPESLMAFGWDREVRVWPQTLAQFFPDLVRAASSAAGGKVAIPYQCLGGASPRAAALSRVVILTHDVTESAAQEPVSGSDVVRALWEAAGIPLNEETRTQTATMIRRLIELLPVHRLPLRGGDLP